MSCYTIGDSDERNWGKYVVTSIKYDGEDCIECQKDITVNPGHMLSVQSHDERAEIWEVTEGILTVILNGEEIILTAGQTIPIAINDIHTMANAGQKPCVVHEIQTGHCRENDIHRFWDPNGRPVEGSDDPRVQRSIALCSDIMDRLKP